jgi:hypothetical protein
MPQRHSSHSPQTRPSLFDHNISMNSKTLRTDARVQSCRKSRHIQGISRSTQQIRRPSVAPARFMRSRDDDVGGKTVLGSTEAPNSSIDLMDMFHNNRSLDEALQGTMSTMSENARESLGRHAACPGQGPACGTPPMCTILPAADKYCWPLCVVVQAGCGMHSRIQMISVPLPLGAW